MEKVPLGLPSLVARVFWQNGETHQVDADGDGWYKRGPFLKRTKAIPRCKEFVSRLGPMKSPLHVPSEPN